MEQQQTDPVDALIDRIAEAVVRRIDERDQIDAIAQAVLARLDESAAAGEPLLPAARARAGRPGATGVGPPKRKVPTGTRAAKPERPNATKRPKQSRAPAGSRT